MPETGLVITYFAERFLRFNWEFLRVYEHSKSSRVHRWHRALSLMHFSLLLRQWSQATDARGTFVMITFWQRDLEEGSSKRCRIWYYIFFNKLWLQIF